MSVSIQCCKGKKVIKEIRIGYNGFRLLRIKIAELFGDPLSMLYKEILDSKRLSFSLAQQAMMWENFHTTVDNLIKKKKVSAKIVRFLMESDTGGRITPNTCKLLLRAIGDYENDFIYAYTQKTPVRFSDFKAILQECVKHNCDMVWY